MHANSQPQWPRGIPVRDYCYTHSQPQWCADAVVALRHPLLPTRVCASCNLAKHLCVCRVCHRCQESVRKGTRHHCRKCWRTVCGNCWTCLRYVHMRGQPVKVCDGCAVPRATVFICRPNERSLLWGLYLLSRAMDMPNVCVAPNCGALTYLNTCRTCGLPTVTTKPHEERNVRVDTRVTAMMETVTLLDSKEGASRQHIVSSYTPIDTERAFRLCFPRYEELDAFTTLGSARDAQDVLLAFVTSAVAYEYGAAPNLTLALTAAPYARLLRLERATPRYSLFEAPGKVKFVAFPGTHNYRTFMVDLRCSRVERVYWSRLVQGVVVGGHAPLHGGVVKTWEYRVHGGFAREADETALPIDRLVEDVRAGYRLVFAGHSLGGAVAQLLALRVLRTHPELLKDRVRCVTLGAPLVGNYQLAQRVERCGWGENFHHFVYRSDLIPRLQCVDEMTRELTDQWVRSAIAWPSSVQRWFTTSRSAAVALEEGSAGESEAMADAADLHIKRGREPLEVEERPSSPTGCGSGGRHSAHRMYACFGRYHFLNHSGCAYFSTNDSEVAFHRLKGGSAGVINVRDHSIPSYNRAIALHLNRR